MSSKKTYLGLSFASLMTKDIVVPKSWVLTGAGNPGDMKGFNEQWFGFKKTYRDRFLYSHIIRKMGSDVSGNGTHFEINDADEKTWNQANIPGYSSKIDSKIGFPSANDLAHLDMQAKFGADWQNTHTLVDSSFKKGISAFAKPSTSSFSYTYSENGNNTTVSNQSNRFQNSSYITRYNSSLSTTPQISIIPADSVSNFAAETSLEFVPFVPVQTNGKRAPIGSENEKNIEWFIKRLGIDKDAIYEELDKIEEKGNTKAIDDAFIMMGIEPRDPYVIPACGPAIEGKIVQELSAKFLKTIDGIDKKVPIEPDQRFNIPCGPDNLRGSAAWWGRKHSMRRGKFAKMFFNLLKFYGTGISTVNFQGMESEIEINFTSAIVPGGFMRTNGKMSTPGSATMTFLEGNTSANANTGAPKSMKIFKQIAADHHEVLTLTVVTQTIKISGERYTLYIDGSWKSSADKNDSGGAGELFPQLWYPKHLYDRLDFTSVIIAREYGTKFLFFSKQVVKTNWIKIIIGIVLIIIVCIYVPAACQGALTMMKGLGLAGLGGGAIAGASGMTMTALVVYAVGVTALGMLVGEMISNIDSPWAKAIAQIAFQAVMMYFGGGLESFTSPENYLMMATQVTTIVYNAYVEIQMKDLGEKRRAKQIAENIDKKLDIDDSPNLSKADTSSHYSQVDQMSPDTMYAQTQNLYNFDQFWAASEQLNTRVNVVPG